jgi:urease accessory protein
MNLARLLQLASPALPVGAYSYSQGLEAAVEAGIVHDAPSAERWIADVLEFCVAPMEGAVVLRQMNGEDLNDFFLASRETAELRAETLQMGYSLCRLLEQLGVENVPQGEVAFPVAFAFAARSWGIPAGDAVQAYLWSWLENQVMAAVKAVPLGQTAGQRMLLSLSSRISLSMENSFVNFAPGLAMLSTQHETQYSRLFRS